MTPLALGIGGLGGLLLWAAVTGEDPVAAVVGMLRGGAGTKRVGGRPLPKPDDVTEPAPSAPVWAPRPAPAPGIPRGVQ